MLTFRVHLETKEKTKKICFLLDPWCISSLRERENFRGSEDMDRKIFSSVDKLREVQIAKLKIEVTFISKELYKEERKDLE